MKGSAIEKSAKFLGIFNIFSLIEIAALCKLRKVLSKNDFTFPFLSNGATDEKQFFPLKLLYCEFQNYDVMTMSEVGSQPKKHSNPTYTIKQQNTLNALI